MNFPEVEKFIRAHWPAAVMVTILVTPAVWSIANVHFSARISYLESQVKDLNERVNVLDELAKRSRKKLEPSEAKFTANELYTPSDDANVQGEIK